jgi:hypothetical protein
MRRALIRQSTRMSSARFRARKRTEGRVEEWTHANSFQVAPTGVVLLAVRHLNTVLAMAPQFDRIVWRIGATLHSLTQATGSTSASLYACSRMEISSFSTTDLNDRHCGHVLQPYTRTRSGLGLDDRK